MNGKQFLALLLAGVLTLSLAACGSQVGGTVSESSQNSASASQAESTSEESEQEPLPDGVVETTAGLVQGTFEDGIYRYLGVPYAQAAERFVPAGEVEPWDGVFVADSYGSMSPQGAISGVGGAADQSGTDNN